MSIQLSWSDRDKPAELVSSLIDSSELLEKFRELLASTFTPEEVFGERELRDFISSTYLPGDMFDESKLIAWAEENGWEKPE